MSDDEESSSSKAKAYKPVDETTAGYKQATSDKIEQLEKQKQLESERRKERERARERGKELAAEKEERLRDEMEEQLEAEREMEKIREREREAERARHEAKELERERRIEQEREKLREQEADKQKKREMEKMERMKERDRQKAEKEKEAARERDKQMEKVRKEEEAKREREKIREEKERQRQEREKQRKIEAEGREKEREKLRELEHQRELEYERERELEAEREREEWEAQKAAERKRIQLELEAQFSRDPNVTDETDVAGIEFRGHAEDPNFVRHNLDRLEAFREGGTHKLPPPPESSLSRIFYKAGPLGPTHRKKPRIDAIKLTWTTRQILSERENFELKVEYDLKELAIFLVYLLLLTIIGYGMITPSMGHLNLTLRHALFSRRFMSEGVDITFAQIHKPIHVFDYLEQVWMNVVYKEFWYIRGYKEIEVSDEDIGVLLENKIFGMPYVQLIRAGTRTCKIHKLFAPLYTECYGYYTPKTQQRKDFIGHEEVVWQWTTGTGYDVDYDGRISTYEPGGFYQNLEDNREDFFLQLQTIKHNLWITRATRALIFNLNVYNANVNLFCIIRVAFEIPPTGGIFPSYNLKAVKLTRYLTPGDYFIMGCEIVFCIFTIFYIAEEMREMFHFGGRYFLSFWCLVDLVTVSLATVLSVMMITRMFGMTDNVYLMITTAFYTSGFQKLANVQRSDNNLLAVTCFFLWIKLLRFLNINRGIGLVGNTLKMCGWELANFFLVFGIIFYAFGILTHAWFGKQLYEYATVGGSMVTLSRILLGDLDYEIIARVDPVLAGVFFVSFVFINLYLLLNMFIAIMCYSYGLVKDDGEYNPKQLTTFNYLMRSVYNMAPYLQEKPKLKITALYAQEKNSITYEEIISVLKSYNFTQDEIRMFLSKYRIREFTITSRWDVQRIVRDMERRGFIPIKPNDEGMTMEEMLEATRLQEEHKGEDNPAYDLTLKEYELLQARLDQIEIQFELMAERLNVINKRTLS